jgi:hypothetical protein
MASYYASITDEQGALIRAARLFFVATADARLRAGSNGVGPVNVSPKGGVPLHILSPNRVAYLDYRGSGNETARHCAMAARSRSWFARSNRKMRQSYGYSAQPVSHRSPCRRSRI